MLLIHVCKDVRDLFIFFIYKALIYSHPVSLYVRPGGCSAENDPSPSRGASQIVSGT